jgi:hypothetical protein
MKNNQLSLNTYSFFFVTAGGGREVKEGSRVTFHYVGRLAGRQGICCRFAFILFFFFRLFSKEETQRRDAAHNHRTTQLIRTA